MAWGRLAGCCRNVIIASVKHSEVKKQERAVLYLADYPHASSGLQGERADCLNRQEQAEHRPYNNLQKHTLTTHTPVLSLIEHKVLLQAHTHTMPTHHNRAFKQGNKGDWEISKLFRLEILQKHISKRMQMISLAGKLNTGISEPV